MMQMRTHTCNELRLSDAGKQVKIVGWMENVRTVGSNFAFVVLRDFYGTTQLVVETEEMMKIVKSLNKESTIAVDGIVRERIETCASNILHHLKVEESFVKPFRDCDSKDAWQFVGCGMLLDALVKAAAHGAGGQAMVDFKNHVLDEVLAAQKEDGRLSIFPDTAHLGVWDNHDQAYFLQGLCREWEYFGNTRALLAAKRLGNYLISPERRTKVNLGIETAFVLLYRATGDERYRDYLRDGFGMLDGVVSYAKNLIDAGVCHGCPLLHVYSWQARALAEAQYADVTGDGDPVLRWSMDELWRRAFSPASSISGTMVM